MYYTILCIITIYVLYYMWYPAQLWFMLMYFDDSHILDPNDSKVYDICVQRNMNVMHMM